MTGAVLIDDAWASCSRPNEAVSVEPASPAATGQHRAARRTLSLEEEVQLASAAAASDASTPPQHLKEKEKGESKCILKMCQELSRMRQQLEERDSAQMVIGYTALAIILMLVVLVLQSFWKLQHATECLLWYSRRA